MNRKRERQKYILTDLISDFIKTLTTFDTYYSRTKALNKYSSHPGYTETQLRRNLRGHNWVFFSHRPQCTVTLNSNFAI